MSWWKELSRFRNDSGSPPLSGRFLTVFAGVIAIIIAFAAIDYGLARADRADRQSSAERFYAEGRRLSAEGDAESSLERFREALAKSPKNEQYQLALILAFQRLGKLDEAEANVTNLLYRDPANGLANVAMARILVARGRPLDAEWYYHRAIYGTWPDHGAAHRVEVRFELANLLANRNAGSELLAELLPLQSEAPRDAKTKMRIARLFLAAGSWARAAAGFTELISQNPRDADAYAGLGSAEFAQRQYAAAQRAFKTSARLEPNNLDVNAKLLLTGDVLSLDPASRNLNAAGRYRRSRELLDRALAQWDACSAKGMPLADEARKLLTAKTARKDDDAIEANIATAEGLAKARAAACGEKSPAPDKALALVLAKLAQ